MVILAIILFLLMMAVDCYNSYQANKRYPFLVPIGILLQLLKYYLVILFSVWFVDHLLHWLFDGYNNPAKPYVPFLFAFMKWW
jgi:hypothetical protein